MKLDLKVDNSRFGKGLFSTRPFCSGELISMFTGQKISFSDTLLLGEFECYPIQIDNDMYLNPDKP